MLPLHPPSWLSHGLALPGFPARPSGHQCYALLGKDDYRIQGFKVKALGCLLHGSRTPFGAGPKPSTGSLHVPPARCSAGYIAQWLERLTADQQVPGSNPGVPFFLVGNLALAQHFGRVRCDCVATACVAGTSPVANELARSCSFTYMSFLPLRRRFCSIATAVWHGWASKTSTYSCDLHLIAG